MRAFVYILECKDGTLYTGWTTNIPKRLREHRLGKGAKYTRGRDPLRLVYYEILKDKSSSLKREAAIKKLSRNHKLMLIKSLNASIFD